MQRKLITPVNNLSQKQRQELVELYQSEFWCHDRVLSEVEEMLDNTDIIIGLVNEQDSLVGFVRILTDYVYKASIYDLIVKNTYRGYNLGKLLMDEIVNHPKLQRVRHFDLHCLPEMTRFYEKWGFSTELGKILAMRRVTWQR